MWSSEKTDKISGALVIALPFIPHAKMDSVNPHFKSKFASLKSILDASRPRLAEHGLFITQEVTPTSVVSRIVHTSGQWIGSECAIVCDKPGPQAQGSAITYARRYSLSPLLGIYSDEDDDGEGASETKPQHKPTSEARNASGGSEDGWLTYPNGKFESDCSACGRIIPREEPRDWNKNTKAVRCGNGACLGDDVPQHIKDAADWGKEDPQDDIPF